VVLRLRWILVVQLLGVQRELARLALVREAGKVGELRNGTRQWNA